jgi:hypothetical protein
MNNQLVKSATRNFYAIKTNAGGVKQVFAFVTVDERNKWLERHQGSHKATAVEVYGILRRQRNEVVLANKNNRVYCVQEDKLDMDKGHRVIFS